MSNKLALIFVLAFAAFAIWTIASQAKLPLFDTTIRLYSHERTA